MKTVYAVCLARLGLSQLDASELHDVSVQSVKNWVSGRSNPPDGVWRELQEVEARIIARSEAIADKVHDAGSPDAIDVRCADHAALLGLADYILSSAGEIATRVQLVGKVH